MDNAKYTFIENQRYHKTLINSARKRKGKSIAGAKGFNVTMPSDYLTAKERKELNGKMSTYDMGVPHKYKEIKEWPVDIQKKYLQDLFDKYSPNTIELRTMLGMKYENYVTYIDSLGIVRKRTHRSWEKQREWEQFMNKTKSSDIAVRDNAGSEIYETPIPKPYIPIMDIQHISIHVTSKPMAIANSIPALLDPNKKYHFAINITEANEYEEDPDNEQEEVDEIDSDESV